MRLQKTKLLTGTALSVLLSVVTMYPAGAQTAGEGTGNGSTMQRMDGTNTNNMMSQQGMRGRIRSIVGEVVTLEMPNGETRAITVSEEQITKLNLRPGMVVIARTMSSSDNANAMIVELANDTTLTTDTMTMSRMRGTVRNVTGDVVTVEMPSGETQTVTLTRSDVDRLRLQPGTEIVWMMNNGVTTVDLASNYDATTGTTGINGSTTTLERRTNISTTQDTTDANAVTAPATTGTTSRTTVTQQRQTTTRTQPAVRRTTTTTRTQPAARQRPVRALW